MSKENLEHIGIVMDGNRRWAKSHGLNPYAGHAQGVKRVEPLVERGVEKYGLKNMTFWAFSTENWQRDPQEIEVLMQVFRNALEDPMLERLRENGVQIKVIGNYDVFPSDIQESIEAVMMESRANERVIVNFALNYGGATEIKDAFNSLIKQGKTLVTEEDIYDNLYTQGQPNPDLIIRTGGEQRTSGFLPLQSAYSEWCFPQTLWPDFTVEEFDKVIENYYQRERRFGK